MHTDQPWPKALAFDVFDTVVGLVADDFIHLAELLGA